MHIWGRKCRALTLPCAYNSRIAVVNVVKGEKQCSRCRRNLPVEQFFKHRHKSDGLQSECKDCHKERLRELYRTNEKFRRKHLNWPKENRGKRAAIVRRYIAGKSETPEFQARLSVKKEIRSGRLLKASELRCVECGKQATHYHHHNGYDQEYRCDVIPVCGKCHQILR